MKKLLSLVALISITAASASALTVSGPVDSWPTSSDAFGVRYKDFTNGGDGAHYVGNDDFQGSNRADEEDYQSYGASNSFSIIYDGLSTVTSTIGSSVLSWAVDPVVIDTLEIFLKEGSDDQIGVSVSDLVVNGEAYGSSLTSPNNRLNLYTVTDLAGGPLEVTGTINIPQGYNLGGDNSVVEVHAYGSAPSPSNVPDSGATALLLGLGMLGLVGARKRFSK